MTGRHDLPEIEQMLIADRRHDEQNGLAYDAARRDCSWCYGTGRRPAWVGWTKVDDEPCVRCAGRGSILVEAECHD